MMKEYLIAACSGRRIDVKRGQTVAVIDVDGGQVVDFFAEAAGLDESYTGFSYTQADLANLDNILANVIRRYC